jgi:hypothetical protein
MARGNGNVAVEDRPASEQSIGATEAPAGAQPATVEATPGALPPGFVRLSDVRKKAASAPSYATLAQFIGQMIVIDTINVEESGKDKRGKSTYKGTMTFAPFDPANPDAEVPTMASPIPGAAIGTIVEALRAHPDDAVVCEVVQTKRGLALR